MKQLRAKRAQCEETFRLNMSGVCLAPNQDQTQLV